MFAQNYKKLDVAMRELIALALMLLISGVSHAKQEEIRTGLSVNEYNDLAQKYMERPTFVMVRGKPGKQELVVTYTPYGGVSFTGDDYATFYVKYADEYLQSISKYLEWAEQATANGDAFDKEIGTVPSIFGMKLKFEFHSGNARSHYLAITLCALGSCAAGKPMYFDIEGARELSALITRLKAGELPGADVGARYN